MKDITAKDYLHERESQSRARKMLAIHKNFRNYVLQKKTYIEGFGKKICGFSSRKCFESEG